MASLTVLHAVDDFSTGSLRSAILGVNASFDATNTIDFAESLFASGAVAIKLLNGELPTIAKPVTITGRGADLLTIDAKGMSRIFSIDDSNSLININVTIVGMTLTGGHTSDVGGAIKSVENLTLTDSIITGNSARNGGGGIHQLGYNGAQLTISNCTISYNSTGDSDGGGGDGGGVFHGTRDIGDQGKLVITGSSIFANEADEGSGGGVFSKFKRSQGATPISNSGVFIDNTRFVNNRADRDGGGLLVALGGLESPIHQTANGLQFELKNSIVSGENQAENRGGGMYLYGAAGTTLTVQDSLITGNDAGLNTTSSGGYNPDSGGGIYAYLFSGDNDANTHDLFARLTISGSTVSDNEARQHGGGIFLCTKRQDTNFSVRSRMSVFSSTISGNKAGRPNESVEGKGGGVAIFIFQNPAFPGEQEGVDARFTNVTVTNNVATLAGGIYSDPPVQPNRITDTWLNNTVASGNRNHDAEPDNLFGSFNVSESYANLIGDNVVNQDPDNRIFAPTGADSGFFLSSLDNIYNLTNDPGLLPLLDNGGPTPTHAPLLTSPTLDHGVNSRAVVPYTSTELGADQRGYSRFVDNFSTTAHKGITDIGAFEYGLVVTTSQDQNGGNYQRNDLSLREAITLAAALQGKNQIEFAPATFGTIVLTAGTLFIGQHEVDIIGPGADRLTLNANGAANVFSISPGISVVAVRNLHLTGATGAAIHRPSGGTQLVIDSLDISGNFAGINFVSGATLVLSKTEISNNTAYGINVNSANFQIDNSTIAQNGSAGLILQFTGGTIKNSTVSGNQNGGITVSFGSPTLVNSTVAFNRADTGNTSGSTATAGIYAGQGAQILLHNSIVAKNTAGATGFESTADLGRNTASPAGVFLAASSHNLIGYAPTGMFPTGMGNMVGTDQLNPLNPGLAPLDKYGGRTRTHSLLSTSMAIDKGKDSVLPTNGLTADQRGYRRNFNDISKTNGIGGTVDIGSIEFRAPIIVSTLQDDNDGNYSAGDVSLREAIALAAANGGRDQVVFDSRLLLNAQQTIVLTSGQMFIGQHEVDIVGPGANRLTINANGASNSFSISPGNSFVAIRNLRLTNAVGSAIIRPSGASQLVIDSVDISGNGSGITFISGGTLVVSKTEVSNNSSYGIRVDSANYQIDSSTIAENGGVGLNLSHTGGPIKNSTISSNLNGGIFVTFASPTLINCTVAFNRADINNPSSTATAGIFAGAAAQVLLHNTIVAMNTAGAFRTPADVGVDASSPPSPGVFLMASSHNLIGYAPTGMFRTDRGNIFSDDQFNPLDPGLAALGEYGGRTRTHKLQSGSQAIDHGDNAIASANGLDCDQRGLDRIVAISIGDIVDIGAVEAAFDDF